MAKATYEKVTVTNGGKGSISIAPPDEQPRDLQPLDSWTGNLTEQAIRALQQTEGVSIKNEDGSPYPQLEKRFEQTGAPGNKQNPPPLGHDGPPVSYDHTGPGGIGKEKGGQPHQPGETGALPDDVRNGGQASEPKVPRR